MAQFVPAYINGDAQFVSAFSSRAVWSDWSSTWSFTTESGASTGFKFSGTTITKFCGVTVTKLNGN